MIPTGMPALANHIWQSTLWAGVMWALSVALRKNRAAVRYWLWLAASVKFLIPFSLFVGIGSPLGSATFSSTAPLQGSVVVGYISVPFPVSAPVRQGAASTAVDLVPTILFGIWFCGFSVSVLFWLRCWNRMRALRQGATPLLLDLPIPALSCPPRVEPGIFGI